MPLNLAALKTDILANAATIQAGQPDAGAFVGVAVNAIPNSGDGNAAVAGWYNLTASPDFYVWRTKVTEDEFVGVAGVDVANSNAATNWSWVGAGFITRSVGERDAWSRIFIKGECNPSLANVRTAFSDILSGGTAPAPANRNHMLVLAKRKANRVEKLQAVGTGTFAVPAVMGFEGSINGGMVGLAMNS